MADCIDSFHDEYRFLSNFWLADVEFEGCTYPSTEHAYQAAKSIDPDEREYVRGLATCGKAKRAGKKITIREDWADVKLDIMLDLVRQKFSRHQDLKDKLLATGIAELIEGNVWHDVFWGVCDGVGQNYLGIILMQVRDELDEHAERDPNVV